MKIRLLLSSQYQQKLLLSLINSQDGYFAQIIIIPRRRSTQSVLLGKICKTIVYIISKLDKVSMTQFVPQLEFVPFPAWKIIHCRSFLALCKTKQKSVQQNFPELLATMFPGRKLYSIQSIQLEEIQTFSDLVQQQTPIFVLETQWQYWGLRWKFGGLQSKYWVLQWEYVSP